MEALAYTGVEWVVEALELMDKDADFEPPWVLETAEVAEGDQVLVLPVESDTVEDNETTVVAAVLITELDGVTVAVTEYDIEKAGEQDPVLLAVRLGAGAVVLGEEPSLLTEAVSVDEALAILDAVTDEVKLDAIVAEEGDLEKRGDTEFEALEPGDTITLEALVEEGALDAVPVRVNVVAENGTVSDAVPDGLDVQESSTELTGEREGNALP